MRTFNVTIALAALAVAGSACGDSAPSQMQAREQATDQACDYFQRCNQIGTNLLYENRDDCEIKIGATFQTSWTPADCTMISATAFDNCLTAIRIADCGSAADFANVVLNKCTKLNVCGKL